ncbi:MAG: tRNA (guanosine(37)-N1)-methyltransferase TrmD [Chitinivibrionales bacterium]|nr:tRNA (guanosine(37)-N1)-methyltransferase TrmD [Chitinivibrionales bacterium]MBD3356951.1 tRNA (guanosine(37)-N1)-methyltransferase TrmD [Chitinivibrionales bacterium]
MLFDILTLFPSMFESAFAESIIRRALDRGLISINIDNIRRYATDRHRTVDDYPYGGDPGMLMMPEPLAAAIESARERQASLSPKVIFLSPQGDLLTQSVVKELLEEQCLILLCGRYKGIDQRIRERYVDREISIGDYVVSGGEIPAMVMVDAVTRLVPGVLGNRDSAERDSLYEGLLAPPQYTRPEVFEGMRVPDVLLSGHHANIRRWRREQAEKITRERRPDLWKRYTGRERCEDNTEKK